MQAVKKNSLFLSLLCLNTVLQITAFCLMKQSWIIAGHTYIKLINYITILAFSATFIRAYVWQTILTYNKLSTSYLANAIVPSLLVAAGSIIFHESITTANIVGTTVILCGLILLGWNPER